MGGESNQALSQAALEIYHNHPPNITSLHHPPSPTTPNTIKNTHLHQYPLHPNTAAHHKSPSHTLKISGMSLKLGVPNRDESFIFGQF